MPTLVAVIDCRGDARAACAGEILVTRLMKRGVAGLVGDGGIRGRLWSLGRLGRQGAGEGNGQQGREWNTQWGHDETGQTFTHGGRFIRGKTRGAASPCDLKQRLDARLRR